MRRLRTNLAADLSCEMCGTIQQAPILILDGTAVSCMKAYAHQQSPRIYASDGSARVGSIQQERILVSNPSTIDVLLEWCAAMNNEQSVTDFEVHMTCPLV
jgi:hypothetical protein